MTTQKYLELWLKIIMVLTVVFCFELIAFADKSPEANAGVARIAAGKR